MPCARRRQGHRLWPLPGSQRPPSSGSAIISHPSSPPLNQKSPRLGARGYRAVPPKFSYGQSPLLSRADNGAIRSALISDPHRLSGTHSRGVFAAFQRRGLSVHRPSLPVAFSPVTRPGHRFFMIPIDFIIAVFHILSTQAHLTDLNL
jgi:hypothetical protein